MPFPLPAQATLITGKKDTRQQESPHSSSFSTNATDLLHMDHPGKAESQPPSLSPPAPPLPPPTPQPSHSPSSDTQLPHTQRHERLPPISQIQSPPPYSQFPSSSLPSSAPRSAHHDMHKVLPPLSSITSDPQSQQQRLTKAATMLAQPPQPPSLWHGPLNPPAAAFHPPGQQRSESADSPNTMDMDSNSSDIMGVNAVSPGNTGSVTLDDPDVRLAAEALGDLRADFLNSPPTNAITLPLSPPEHSLGMAASPTAAPPSDQPLLSLLTTAHPLFKSTIGGASFAYGGAKNFSPRFKSSAEYVEGYLGPIAHTVGNVSRATGVEGGVRWFLGGGRRANSSEHVGNSKKRRKMDADEDLPPVVRTVPDVMRSGHQTPRTQDSYPPTPKGDRRLSMASTIDTLPAYDDMRSPAYTEMVDTTQQVNPRTNIPTAWQHRLIMSTSGLSVAMSQESLRSLKYCLRWLKWANEHIAHVTVNLKTTIDQYDEAAAQTHLDEAMQAEEGGQYQQMNSAGMANGEGDRPTDAHRPSRRELAAKIHSLKGDVLKTLQDVVNTVSTYAGGALPENAKILVRRHLTSLPQRFRVATMNENGGEGGANDKDSENALREGAQKILVLAKEGLDMVTQISGVLDGTIMSAEQWCDRMGKRRRREEDEAAGPALPRAENEPLQQ